MSCVVETFQFAPSSPRSLAAPASARSDATTSFAAQTVRSLLASAVPGVLTFTTNPGLLSSKRRVNLDPIAEALERVLGELGVRARSRARPLGQVMNSLREHVELVRNSGYVRIHAVELRDALSQPLHRRKELLCRIWTQRLGASVCDLPRRPARARLVAVALGVVHHC